MISYQHMAFMIGLLGSVHCIGMCGPLAFSVPSHHTGRSFILLDKLFYQTGRILSYCLLGIVVGFIGRQVWLAGFQQGVSIFSGILIVLAALSRLFKISIGKHKSSWMLVPFYRLFNYALKHKANHFFIGIINGLLPCGFVYLAMAGALNSGSMGHAVLYMFWFGIGTAPLMFIAAVSISFSGPLFRKKINKVIPFLMLFLGIWFIFRGLELNIPYLSPGKARPEVASCG